MKRTAYGIALVSALCLGLSGPVLAGNGNGKDNGKGHSAESHGNGAVASELKSLNSSHANENALEHADEDSAVGKNAAYVASAKATVEADTTLALATQAQLDAMAELKAAQDALQAAVDAGEDTTAAQARVDAAVLLVNQTTAALTAAQDVHDMAAEAEHDALMAATGGVELSEAALAEYRANLGL